MNRIAPFLIIGTALLLSCSKSSTTPDYTPDCSGPAKSFSTDVLPVLQSACVGCHSNFSSYAQVVADKAGIRSNIASGNMPRGSTLTSAQKNKVVCWIDSGTPNN